MSGRIADIAIHPRDQSTWYVAVGSGNLWKTTNAGTTWRPIFDDQASYSIGCVTIDPASPYYKKQFGEDKTYLFFCAGGLRSVLAAEVAQRMGLKPVAHIIGGFAAWKDAGGNVELPE